MGRSREAGLAERTSQCCPVPPSDFIAPPAALVQPSPMKLRDTAFAALALAFALPGSASAATNERSTPFGTFSLIEEVRKVDPGEAPIIRVGTEGTKLHLRWRSADSRAGSS
jgi:hypothetical protein